MYSPKMTLIQLKLFILLSTFVFIELYGVLICFGERCIEYLYNLLFTIDNKKMLLNLQIIKKYL